MSSSHEQHHRAAADRHERAARCHEQSARFWDQLGDPHRAALQREMAAYERHGAELERRWAELEVDTEASPGAPALEPVRRHVHENAAHLASALRHTAELFEESAALADEHATHPAIIAAGRDASERETAERAREGAQWARAQAGQWRALSDADQHRPRPIPVDNY